MTISAHGIPQYQAGGVGSEFKLLIHSNTTDGSTVFTDSSPETRTVTVYGNTQHDTAQAKFGGSAVYFDGTGDYLTAGSITIGTGDYTVDFWVRPEVVNSIDGYLQIGAFNAFAIYIHLLRVRVNTNGLQDVLTSNFINANEWSHIAVVRSGNSLYLFLNGILQGSVASSNYSIPLGLIFIGYYYSSSYTAQGHMDEITIRDEAVWTANFTPPTAPYEA